VNKPDHYHFIAIGGAIMHNLAIELKKQGYYVTGSDDEIFEPSKSRLEENGLLPERTGWFPDNITSDTKAIILGMHAREDNPELLEVKRLGIRVYSFPEFIYKHAIDKKRVVIGGSHGKTTITSAIIHVLSYFNIPEDHLVGALTQRVDSMVKLTKDAPVIVIEGDEYLTSTLDRTPKFLRYHHNIGLISGIEWDHINAFPKVEEYVLQFRKFIENTTDDGYMIYNSTDQKVCDLIESFGRGNLIPYQSLPYIIKDGIMHIETDSGLIPLKVFGDHNAQNLSGALEVLKLLGISENQFYEAIQSYEGASNRLELLYNGKSVRVFKDFAHAPSKVRATLKAVREKFPGKKIVAFCELHTYSSLNKNFINNYKGALDPADYAYVFLDDHTMAIKKMENIPDSMIISAFKREDIEVIRSSERLTEIVNTLKNTDDPVFLFMSSGKFGRTDLKSLFSDKT